MEELRLSYESTSLRLRIGPDSLLGHATPEPPGPLLLQACRAVVALASGARDRVSLPFQGGALLRLATADHPGSLLATVTSGDGIVLLSAAEVPARPFLHSLTEAMDNFLEQAEGADIAQALAQAAVSLALLPEAVDRFERAPADPTGPIELHHDDVHGLRVRLGTFELDVSDVDRVALASSLVAGVQELLQTRDWPAGAAQVVLDRTGRRTLALWRGEGLSAAVLDEGQRPLCPRHALTVADLAWAALQCIHPTTEVEAARRELLRLIRWEQALRHPTAATRPVPPGWRAPKVSTPASSDDLPVGRLRHLAWRRVWRREAPGLQRVEPAGARLYIHGDGGLVAVDARTGALRWRRPEARPLQRGDAGLVVDEEGALLALDARTGRVLWRVLALDEGPFYAAWRSRRRVLAMSDATLFGLEDGRTTWRYDACFGQIHQVVTHGPLAWMTADDGILHAVRLADGTRQFALPVQGDPEEGLLLVPEGLLVSTQREPEGRGLLNLLDPLTGAIRWRIGLEGPLLGPPVVLGDGVVQAHGSTHQVTLECVGLADGQLRWRHRQLPVGGHPRLVGGDPLLVKTPDGGLVALEPTNGRIRWSLAGEDDEAHLLRNPLPERCRGVLLVPGATVRAVDPQSGRLIRRLDCGELVPAWLHAWPSGDLVIAEDDAVAHYTLGGHLALV